MHHIIPAAACRLAGRTAPHLARRGLVLVILAGLGLVVGCGRNRGPVVQFVEGKVVLDGESLEIQGDHLERLRLLFSNLGYKVRG